MTKHCKNSWTLTCATLNALMNPSKTVRGGSNIRRVIDSNFIRTNAARTILVRVQGNCTHVNLSGESRVVYEQRVLCLVDCKTRDPGHCQVVRYLQHLWPVQSTALNQDGWPTVRRS